MIIKAIKATPNEKDSAKSDVVFHVLKKTGDANPIQVVKMTLPDVQDTTIEAAIDQIEEVHKKPAAVGSRLTKTYSRTFTGR